MAESMLERTRTGWDVALGALLVIGGLVVLGHATIATTVSVLFLGWMLLVFGVAGLIGALFRIGKGGFWASAVTGGLLTVLGVFTLNNTGAAALTLTLLAGALFLSGGIVRLVAAGAMPEYRIALIFGGIVSVILGLMVLFNLFTATYVLLGVLIGIEMIADGIALMLVGRVRITEAGAHPQRMAT
jgi:uncharacterized membrane protein HdeD (DUF308 family)